MRALVNEIEADLCKEIVIGAMGEGNVVGAIGTNPFATDTKAFTKALKVLKDKGSPQNDLMSVINTESGMNLRDQDKLFKVNESGDNGDLLRRGILGDLYGFTIRESAGMKAGATGTAKNYLVNGAGAKGSKIVAIDTGSGTFLKGDVIKFGDGAKQYIVAEDVVSGGTEIKLATALEETVADNTAVTIVGAFSPNACFSRGAVALATRVPAIPAGGDNAKDRTIITDPVSGLSFEVALWGGQYQNTVTISAVWGVKNTNPAHTVAVIG